MSIRILHFDPEKFEAQLLFIALQTERLQHGKDLLNIDYVGSFDVFKTSLKTGLYHVIISETTLPGISPEGLLSFLQSEHVASPILFVTNQDNLTLRKRLLLQGASDYILKSERSHLAEAIESLLNNTVPPFETAPFSSGISPSEKKRVLIDDDDIPPPESPDSSNPFYVDPSHGFAEGNDGYFREDTDHSALSRSAKPIKETTTEFERFIRSTKPGAAPMPASEDSLIMSSSDESSGMSLTDTSEFLLKDASMDAPRESSPFEALKGTDQNATFFSTVLNQVNDAILVLHQEKIVMCNHVFCTLTGKKENDIQGLSFLEHFIPAHDAKRLRELLIADMPQRGEFTLLSGRSRTSIQAHFSHTVYNGFDSILIILENITEKRAQERATLEREERYRQQFDTFKERQERYRLTFENAQLPSILEIDVSPDSIHQIDDVNFACLHHLGFSREEMLPKTVIELVKESDQEAFFHTRQKAFEESPQHLSCHLLTSDNTEIAVRISMYVFPIDQKQILFTQIDVSGSAMESGLERRMASGSSSETALAVLKADLDSERQSFESLESSFSQTEAQLTLLQQKRLEEQQHNERLKGELQLHRFLLDSVPTGIIWLDSSGKIIFINKAAEAFHRLSKESAVGQKAEALLGYKYNSAADRLNAKHAIESEKPWVGEIRLDLAPGQSRIAELRLERITLSPTEPKGLCMMINDITAEKERALHNASIEAKANSIDLNEGILLFGVDATGQIHFLSQEGHPFLSDFPIRVGQSIYEVFAGDFDVLSMISRVLSGENVTHRISASGVFISGSPQKIGGEGFGAIISVSLAHRVAERI